MLFQNMLDAFRRSNVTFRNRNTDKVQGKKKAAFSDSFFHLIPLKLFFNELFGRSIITGSDGHEI